MIKHAKSLDIHNDSKTCEKVGHTVILDKTQELNYWIEIKGTIVKIKV